MFLIVITALAAGFYLYLGGNNQVGELSGPEPPAAQKDIEQSKQSTNANGTIILERPPFLEE